MASAPYWLDAVDPVVPGPRRAGRVDVEIVGGGVTGCSAALALARAGLRVRLHEAREIASGASGRNAGFALRGGSMPYDRARALLGRAGAAALWRLTERALDEVERLAGDALRRTGSLRVAASGAEREDLRAELEALHADGFEAGWVDAVLPAGFQGALHHPRDGALHPVAFVRRLAAAAAAAGADLREHSRVRALESLDADHVLVATDGATGDLLPELDGVVRPTRGQVLATAPLPRRLFACPHYARYGYDYWQQLPDGTLLVGGFRDASLDTEWTAEESTTAAIQGRIEQLARALAGGGVRVTHRWAGIWGTTGDGLPLAGALPTRPRAWVALGYTGHGNVLGFAAGRLVAAAILGDPPPELALLDPARVVARREA